MSRNLATQHATGLQPVPRSLSTGTFKTVGVKCGTAKWLSERGLVAVVGPAADNRQVTMLLARACSRLGEWKNWTSV